VYEDDGLLRAGIEIGGSTGQRSRRTVFGRRGAGKADVEARALSLEAQLLGAQAQVRSLESTIGILRHRMDVEVLEDIGVALERGAQTKPADAARVYAAQLVATRERLEALIADNGPLEQGGSAAEREVVQLRRQLAIDRVRLAEVSQERDELRHHLGKAGTHASGGDGASATHGGERARSVWDWGR
jgi:hypothetical protein